MKFALEWIWLMTFLIVSCSNLESQASRWLEDIPFDPKIDDENFELCLGDENAIQYYRVNNNTGSKGFKPQFLKLIDKKYDSNKVKKETGLLRIRFIVNCKGEADRFRILGSTLDYKEYIFDSSISDQLLQIVKSIDNWNGSGEEVNTDYYNYVLFRIIDGKIITVLP